LAVYFFDSSAIVKHYVQEAGTQWIRNLINPSAGNDFYLARITGVEVVSAITRRQRDGTMNVTDATLALTQFRMDFDSEYQVIEITPALLTRAMSLAETHALRAYDAVQLAAASAVNDFCTAAGLPSLTLISADAALNSAATAEGLIVDDPNIH